MFKQGMSRTLLALVFITVAEACFGALGNTEQVIDRVTLARSLNRVGSFLNLREERIPELTGDPVALAIMAHDLDLVKARIYSGNVARKNAVEITPLGFACLVGAPIPIVEYLLGLGAPINERSGFSNTPFLYASAFGDEALLQYLVDQGAKARVYNSKDETPLLLAAKFSPHPKALSYLVGLGLDVNQSYNNGDTPLLLCAQFNMNPGVLEELISLGASVIQKGPRAANPVARAASVPFIWLHPGNRYWPNARNCRILLDSLNDPIEAVEVATGALGAAAANADIEVIKVLFEYGASVDALRAQKSSPILSAASSNSNTEVLQYLLDHGCTLNDIGTENGWTALFYAADRSKYPEIVMYLVDHGADVASTDLSGKTALFYVERRNMRLPAEYLQKLKGQR